MLKVFGLVRMVCDPVIRKVPVPNKGEVSVARFTVAHNEYRKVNGENVRHGMFFDCEAWDSGADILAEQVKKGDLIGIEARLREEKWEDKDTGKTRRKNVLRVEKFEIASRAKNNVKDDDVDET